MVGQVDLMTTSLGMIEGQTVVASRWLEVKAYLPPLTAMQRAIIQQVSSIQKMRPIHSSSSEGSSGVVPLLTLMIIPSRRVEMTLEG